MNYTKTILCLAKSWKLHGHCVAGRTFSTSAYMEWVRPVSARPDEEISDQEVRYTTGDEASVLDLIEVPLLRPVPHLHQVENHLINSTVPWKKVGQANWNNLLLAVQNPPALWLNGDSSYNGINDRVAEMALARLGSSLYLIRPENVSIAVGMEGPLGRQHRKVRATFDYAGSKYAFGVTDPVASGEYLQNGDGRYLIGGDVLFCVSLGGAFRGHAYKLVAGVFTPSRTALKL